MSAKAPASAGPNDPKRIALPVVAITGGGTGGHVYPGLAVARALGYSPEQPNGTSARLLFFGSNNGMERDLISRAGLPFVGVASAALRGRGPIGKATGALRVLLGVAEAARLLKRHRVQAILATGGYVSAPVVLGGWLGRIPSLIYLPDVEPGLAVRFLSRFAHQVAVTCDDSRRFLPGRKVVATGYPIRPELCSTNRNVARRELGIEEHETVLLVVGGSRGAHSINSAVATALPALLKEAIVLHSSGPVDEPWLRGIVGELPAELQSRYHLAAYFHEELAPAMAAADLAISRAGASVMGEYPHFGLPTILIPYPHAGAHQGHNADFLVSKGAALQLADEELGKGVLLPTVIGLLGNRVQLKKMSDAASRLSRPDAARLIARELLLLCSSM